MTTPLSGQVLLNYQEPVLKHHGSLLTANKWPHGRSFFFFTSLQRCSLHILQSQPTRWVWASVYMCRCIHVVCKKNEEAVHPTSGSNVALNKATSWPWISMVVYSPPSVNESRSSNLVFDFLSLICLLWHHLRLYAINIAWSHTDKWADVQQCWAEASHLYLHQTFSLILITFF